MKLVPPLLAVLLSLAPRLSAEVVENRGLTLSAHDGLVSVDWKDASLEDALRLLARVGGVNLVVDPAASGRTITLALHDVHWEQALRLACSVHGLGTELEGNILRVAPVAKLTAERQQLAQLQASREESAPLVTVAFPLSWTDARSAEAIVRRSLTARGSTAVDVRTNTLLVTDVPGSPVFAGLDDAAPSAPREAGPPGRAITLRLLGTVPEDIVSIRAVEAPGDGPRTLASTVELVEGRRIEVPGIPGMQLGLERDGSRLVLIARSGRAGAHLPAEGRQAFALSGASGGEALLVAEAN